MQKILVSACLMGQAVRYDGGAQKCTHPTFERWRAEGRLIAVCPEVQGGLPTPRPPAEVQGGNGDAVLAGASRVLTIHGEDVTRPFLAGAQAALGAAQSFAARMAILKADSPSCGSLLIYDGSFCSRLAAGRGVAAALLETYGIRVFDETQIDAAAAYLAALEISR